MKLYNKLSVIISPTDACNMHCVYCFHLKHRMKSDEITIDAIKHFYQITFPHYEAVHILWHGGEPLLMGLDFFRQAIDLQNKYKYTSSITNAIQSNLTLMTEEFAVFFKKNNVGISSSYDGILNFKTRGSSEGILSGREKVTRLGMKCGFIMTVSSMNVHTLIDSYEYFKSQRINYRLNLYVGNPKDKLSLNSEVAIKELTSLFDYYVNDESCNILIKFFSSFLEYFIKGKLTLCSNISCLGHWIGMQHNGDISPCNRYFPRDYSYGNIFDYDNISQAFDSDGFKCLILKAIERRKKCKDCEIFCYCNGGNTCTIIKSLFHYIEKWYENFKANRLEYQVKNTLLLNILNSGY